MYSFAKSVLVFALLPPSGPLLIVFAGLALGIRRPKFGSVIAMAGALALWLASTPLVVTLLTEKLGLAQPVNLTDAKQAQAIVVLGVGLQRTQEYGGDTLGRLTLERVRYAAELARQTGLPVLASGGTPSSATRSEADLMRQALQVEFSVAVPWIEDRSTNTRENAVGSAALLREKGVQRIVLVTHAFDAVRARRQFELAGLEVVSAPTHVPMTTDWTKSGLRPNANAMLDCFYLSYEALALVADRVLPGG